MKLLITETQLKMLLNGVIDKDPGADSRKLTQPLIINDQWNWAPQVKKPEPNAQQIVPDQNINPEWTKTYDPNYKEPDPNMPNRNPTVIPQIPIPPQLKDINGVKAFQNWLDLNHRGWVRKYNVLGGSVNKGFGKFGPNTLRSWNLYGNTYLSSSGYTPTNLSLTPRNKPVTSNTTNNLPTNNTLAPNNNPVSTNTPQKTKSGVLIPPGNEMMSPLGKKVKIKSGFGIRNANVRGSTKNHKGVDLRTPSGSPIYAPANGIVEFAGDTTPNGCGGNIRINHGNLKTKFCHIKKWDVTTGQQVQKGQIIGYSGGGPGDPYRGTSSGPHLHYEILDSGGVALNPINVQSNLA